MNPLMHDIAGVLISGEQIQKRVAQLADQITKDYQDKELMLICVLKGASIFFADLFKRIELPVSCEFIAISSYGAATKSSGVVRLIKDVDTPVAGKHILFVEDIVDSGLSMHYLTENFATRGALSVCVCTLFDKPARRRVALQADYVGFDIPNEFIVGYGLDYNEKYRNLPDVCVLKPQVYA